MLEDVLDRRVSREMAASQYGVIIVDTNGTLAVDTAATETRRNELGQQRGPVSWLFDRGENFERLTGTPARQ